MSARWRSGMPVPDGVRPDRIEPLWTRVDRNRAKFAFFITVYLLSIAVSAGLMAGVAVFFFAVFAPSFWGTGFVPLLAGSFLVSSTAALVLGSGWVAYAMLRSEKRLLAQLGAVLTKTGEHVPTKMALKDMALAAGFDRAPALWLITECGRINAFAVGRTHSGAVVGVTEGFVDRLTEDEQRAVFANLMARLCNDDVRFATAVSALVGPLWRLREADIRGNETLDKEMRAALEQARAGTAPTEGSRAQGAAAYFILYLFVIVVTELLLIGHQNNTLLTAEKADAEGMLLLKDPCDMLRALEKVLDANNTVPTAGEAYSGLFYCWAGVGYAPEDDPEYRRISRLREVLGVEGLLDTPEAADFVSVEEALPPPAPRIDRQREPGR